MNDSMRKKKEKEKRMTNAMLGHLDFSSTELRQVYLLAVMGYVLQSCLKTNSADPDQTATLGAVCSGSTLFL